MADMAPMTNNQYFLFSAWAMMARRVPNSTAKSTEFIDLPELAALSFTVEKTNTPAKSVVTGIVGVTRANLPRVNEVSVSLAIHTKHSEAFRAALSGTAVALTGAGGDVTGESITFPAADLIWFPLANKRISSPVIAAAVLGVDYEIRAASGMIRSLPAGSLAGTTTTINYTWAAESGTLQNIGNLSQVEWAIQAELTDQYESDKDPVLCIIHATSIDPEGAVKMAIEGPEDSEHSVMVFSGKCRLLPGESAAAYLDGLPVQLYDWPTP